MQHLSPLLKPYFSVFPLFYGVFYFRLTIIPRHRNINRTLTSIDILQLLFFFQPFDMSGAVVSVSLQSPWKSERVSIWLLLKYAVSSLSISSLERGTECNFSLLRSTLTTLTETSQFFIRLEADVCFEFHLVCFQLGRGDRFQTVQLYLKVADAVEVNTFPFPEAWSHKVAQWFEDRFYISFGQRSRLLYFFGEIVGVDMLKVDYRAW